MTPERILRAAEILRENAAELMRSECIHSGGDLVWPDGTEEAQSACNEMSGLAAELEALSASHLALEPGRDYTVVPNDDLTAMTLKFEQAERAMKWLNEVGPPDHPDDERHWAMAYVETRRRAEAAEHTAAEAGRELAALLEDSIYREYNPFEPANQSVRYHELVARRAALIPDQQQDRSSS